MEGQTELNGQGDELHGGLTGLEVTDLGGLDTQDDAPAADQPTSAVELAATDAELMTQMLYTDAIIGVGFPNLGVALRAERSGIAYHDASASYAVLPQDQWRWSREKLELLPLPDLIELYLGLKGMVL